MNRAHQQALFQQTNQAVLGIRQLEINYYANLYGQFGTQAVLLGGFVYSTFTQNNNDEGNPHEEVFIFLYSILAAATIAFAVHIMLCTMILQVYGPGLALHGPLGSMARAAEGMRIEQNQIIISFLLLIVSFALSTIWSFWSVMTTKEAFTCTAVFVIAARQWYYYSERIYLKFYWNKNETNWNNGEMDQNDVEFDREPQIPGSSVEASSSNNPLQTLASSPSSRYQEKKLHFPFALPFTSGKKSADNLAQASAEATNAEKLKREGSGTAISGDAKGVDLNGSLTKTMIAMEGYITTGSRSEHSSDVIFDSKRWERQYFILFLTGEFYLYKSRQHFRSDPKNPVYLRPLRLIDFYVTVDNVDQALRAENEDDNRSVVSTAVTARVGGGNRDSTKKKLPFRFQITLSPRESEEENFDQGQQRARNHWVLRCDTEEELEIWVGSIRDVCPSCFRSNDAVPEEAAATGVNAR